MASGKSTYPRHATPLLSTQVCGKQWSGSQLRNDFTITSGQWIDDDDDEVDLKSLRVI